MYGVQQQEKEARETGRQKSKTEREREKERDRVREKEQYWLWGYFGEYLPCIDCRIAKFPDEKNAVSLLCEASFSACPPKRLKRLQRPCRRTLKVESYIGKL